MRRMLLACVILAAGGMGVFAQSPGNTPLSTPAPTRVRVRGTIVALVGDRLTVQGRAASVFVDVPADATITAATEAKLSDVAPGSYIGSAAIRQPDGSLRALEVHIFPEAMRGTGEGSRTWDLGPDSSMTNGTVGRVAGSTGRDLVVDYNGGQKTVSVPPDVPVIAYAPGTRTLLVPGSNVIIIATRAEDGSLHTDRVTVAAPDVRLAM